MSMCLVGCTVGSPAAFRLTDSGDLHFAICLGESEFDRVEVALTPQHWFWEHPDDVVFVADAVEPISIRSGDYFDLADPRLDWDAPLSLEGDWSTVEVSLFGPSRYEGGSIDPSRLIIDEWVWDHAEMRGQTHCDPIEGVPAPLP